MTNEELREALLAAPKNGYATLTAEQRAEMESYCKRYSAFMDAAKTEREATTWAVAEAEKHGFQPLVPGMDLKPGTKVYLNNRDKSIILAVLGSEPLANGVMYPMVCLLTHLRPSCPFLYQREGIWSPSSSTPALGQMNTKGSPS